MSTWNQPGLGPKQLPKRPEPDVPDVCFYGGNAGGITMRIRLCLEDRRAFGALRSTAVVASLLALTSLPVSLDAQEYGRTVSVHGGLGLGGFWSDESFNGNGLSFGGAVAVFPTSVLGFEVGVDGGAHSRDFDSGVRIEGTAAYFSGNVLIRFSRSRVQPYLIGGVGLLQSSTDRIDLSGEPLDLTGESGEDTVMGNVGVGLFLFASPRVSVRPEFRVVAYDDSSPVTFYYRASVARGYHF
jgi:hypothetical protein